MEYSVDVLDYEQRRFDYFKQQIAHYDRSLNWWMRRFELGGYRQFEIEDHCSECGERIGFYEDALRALGDAGNGQYMD